MHTERTNLVGLDRPALEQFFMDLGERSFRAGQILRWVHQRRVLDFAEMTDLGKGLRSRLGEIADLSLPQILSDQVSRDGARKWLLQLRDGNCIETVFIPDAGRGTLCVSSQVGCALNCSFCATARQGFNRNLDSAEIIGQVWQAQRVLCRDLDSDRPISNVVMMGMGEPLLNFDAVVAAMNLMLDDLSFGLSRRRVTLSTAGVVPGIRRMKTVCPVSLALSLHAPDDDLRDQLVPLNKKYPIAEVLDACSEFVADEPRRKITIEYAMLEGINDSLLQARQLGHLLRSLPVKINLIPFNPFPGTDLRCTPLAQINRFRDILMAANLMTVTRKTRGDDIAAACGQLAGRFHDRTKRSLGLAKQKVVIH